jgi:shikimate kinase
VSGSENIRDFPYAKAVVEDACRGVHVGAGGAEPRQGGAGARDVQGSAADPAVPTAPPEESRVSTVPEESAFHGADPEVSARPHLNVGRVVLLGYMCSGKSTVGEALARRLEWSYLDFDVEIERREGATVQRIVAAAGEERFREMEAALTAEAARAERMVLAPGGGWVTRPEFLDALGAGTLAVWLQVSPEETVRRLRGDTVDRPFRDHPDPAGLIAEMLAERIPLYERADLSIPADTRTPESIAYEIEVLVRTRNAL